MFGLGEQNKEKLEQNMEEIKNMVDEESDMPDLEESSEWSHMAADENWEQSTDDAEQVQQPAQEQPGQMEEIEQSEAGQTEPAPEPDQEQPQGEAFESFNDTISGSEALQEEIESFEESMEQEMEDEAWEKQQNQHVQSPREKNTDSSRERTAEKGRTSSSGTVAPNAEIPEPAKTKKIDVPEIDKGPLFIRQNKFERATQLIYDMKYLSDEIQSIVNAIEGDLERDRETENQLIEALGEFEDGRTQVERIISPGEE